MGVVVKVREAQEQKDGVSRSHWPSKEEINKNLDIEDDDGSGEQ